MLSSLINNSYAANSQKTSYTDCSSIKYLIRTFFPAKVKNVPREKRTLFVSLRFSRSVAWLLRKASNCKIVFLIMYRYGIFSKCYESIQVSAGLILIINKSILYRCLYIYIENENSKNGIHRYFSNISDDYNVSNSCDLIIRFNSKIVARLCVHHE